MPFGFVQYCCSLSSDIAECCGGGAITIGAGTESPVCKTTRDFHKLCSGNGYQTLFGAWGRRGKGVAPHLSYTVAGTSNWLRDSFCLPKQRNKCMILIRVTCLGLGFLHSYSMPSIAEHILRAPTLGG